MSIEVRRSKFSATAQREMNQRRADSDARLSISRRARKTELRNANSGGGGERQKIAG